MIRKMFDIDRTDMAEQATIGIVGLGLIGGSFARAYKEKAPGFKIYAANRTAATLERAVAEGVVDGELDKDTIGECDLIIVNLFPDAAIRYIEDNKQFFKPNTIVTDACGNKRGICAEGFELAENDDFCFIGAHPMAGSQYSGYDHSRADMFDGASMILVPTMTEGDEITPKMGMIISRLKTLLAPLGFGEYVVTDAATHDKMIAYTSQLGHVMASSYVRNPLSLESPGFTGGSFRDMTRIAYCNPEMWSELFIENRDNLAGEIDNLIGELVKYREAIASADDETLKKLLDEGTRRKDKITPHD